MHTFVTLISVFLSLTVFSLPAMATDMPYRGDGHIMINPDDLAWGPVASMADGAEIAVIEGSLSEAEAFTFRLRMPANYRIEPHIHPAYERVTVLRGELCFGHGEHFDKDTMQRLVSGSVAIMAPGEPMYGLTGDEKTVIQLHGTGPWGIEYINPDDDPRM